MPDDPVPPVPQPLPGSRYTGARLGKKRYEVERLLLQGEPKLKIARMLKISAHSVRAVAHDLDAGQYAAPSGAVELPTPKKEAAIFETLRAKAREAVNHITPEKLEKSTASALALTVDRLINRADLMEDRTGNRDTIETILTQLGIQPSHASSRVTVRETKEVEVITEHQ